jgi:hypothetical protein
MQFKGLVLIYIQSIRPRHMCRCLVVFELHLLLLNMLAHPTSDSSASGGQQMTNHTIALYKGGEEFFKRT